MHRRDYPGATPVESAPHQRRVHHTSGEWNHTTGAGLLYFNLLHAESSLSSKSEVWLVDPDRPLKPVNQGRVPESNVILGILGVGEMRKASDFDEVVERNRTFCC